MANIVHTYAAERFTAEQRRLILDTCCQGAGESEAQALIAVAETRGLNPLLGECYFVQRWDSNKGRNVWAVQASIDSLRIRAESTGLYAGQDEPEYEYDPKTGELALARVRVYRSDWPRPSIGVARWSEYVQKTKEGQPTKFWKTSPHNQLAKCAEALAIRKAFPKQLAKLYIKEEAGAAGDTEGEDVAAEAGDTAGAAAGFKTALLQAQNAETLDAVMAEIKDAIARKHVKMEDAVELRKTASAKRKEFKSVASADTAPGNSGGAPADGPDRKTGPARESVGAPAESTAKSGAQPTQAAEPPKDAGTGTSRPDQSQSPTPGSEGGAPSGEPAKPKVDFEEEARLLWDEIMRCSTQEELDAVSVKVDAYEKAGGPRVRCIALSNQREEQRLKLFKK